jgi:hypothetical protein
MDRSLAGILAFLDWLGSKGLVARNTAFGRKAAVSNVLGVLEPEEQQDVTQVDLGLAMKRFANLHGKRYTPKSLHVYEGRVRRSIDDFNRYLADPSGFRVNDGPRKAKPSNSSKPAKSSGEQEAPSFHTQPLSAGGATANVYPIPIRADLVVRIHGLPFDLTKSEAEKIANVVRAMAMGDS